MSSKTNSETERNQEEAGVPSDAPPVDGDYFESTEGGERRLLGQVLGDEDPDDGRPLRDDGKTEEAADPGAGFLEDAAKPAENAPCW